MPISGSDQALMYAYLGNTTSNPSGTGLHRPMRLGASRLGYYPPHTLVKVGGTLRQGLFDDFTWTVRERLWDQPDEAEIDLFGFTVTEGQELIIACGSIANGRLFRGQIVKADTTFIRLSEGRRVTRARALDWSFLFDRALVTQKWVNRDAAEIIVEIVTDYTSGFTFRGVQRSLGILDEFSAKMEPPSTVLSRILRRIGGYWEIREDKDVAAWTGDAGLTNPRTITSTQGRQGNKLLRRLNYSRDLAKIVTRAVVEGGGSTLLVDAAVGQTTLPIEEPGWYAAAGGEVVIDNERVTYTGIEGADRPGSDSGYIAPPPAPTFVNSTTGGSLDVGATYQYALTYITAEGETSPSEVLTAQLDPGDDQLVTNIAAPIDPKVTGINVYRTEGNGAVLKFLTAFAVTGGQHNDIRADSLLTADEPPTDNTAGFASLVTDAGSTTLSVADLSQFPDAGWGEAPGGQIFSWSGRSASTGSGTLTGIPASGPGSLTAAVRAGTITVVPHLTGIPASGAGSITNALERGLDVNILVTRNDTTAQAAIAALEGGDGIHEKFIQQRQLNQASCEALGDAELTVWKTVLEQIDAISLDPHARAGRLLAVNVSEWSLDVELRIQSAEIRRVPGYDWPQRTLVATSQTRSLYDVLRSLKEAR